MSANAPDDPTIRIDSNAETQEALELISFMKPIINQYLLPPSVTTERVSESMKMESRLYPEFVKAHCSSRRKFSFMDDNFLILGLQEFGYRNVEKIRINWLPKKHTNEIKHRYKNLTCARVPINLIKKWKIRSTHPLTDRELYVFAKSVKWFGDSTNRWGLISKCFLPERTAYFLRVEYYNRILCDFEKQERFGKLMLLDVDDHPQFYFKGQDHILTSLFTQSELAEHEIDAKLDDTESPAKDPR